MHALIAAARRSHGCHIVAGHVARRECCAPARQASHSGGTRVTRRLTLPACDQLPASTRLVHSSPTASAASVTTLDGGTAASDLFRPGRRALGESQVTHRQLQRALHGRLHAVRGAVVRTLKHRHGSRRGTGHADAADAVSDEFRGMGQALAAIRDLVYVHLLAWFALPGLHSRALSQCALVHPRVAAVVGGLLCGGPRPDPQAAHGRV